MQMFAQGVVTPPDDVMTDINKLLGYAAGIVFVVCLAKVIFVGGRLAWDHKHGAGLESPPAAEFLAANIGAILAGGVSVTIATILLATSQGPQMQGPVVREQGTVVEQLEHMQIQQQPTLNEGNER